ncbi:MAG: MarR family winged helix-turn-helix transcriptional regulator [Acholeplasmataceae bacterium]
MVKELQLDLKLLTVIFRSFESIKDVLKEDVKHYDLNITEFGTLEYLYHKGPSPISVIGDKVLLAKSSMSYVIEQLKQKGYIEWIKDDNDQRKRIVGLTTLGEKTIKHAFEKHLEVIGKMFDVLTEEEKKILIQDLKKIGYYAKDLLK